MKGTGQSAFRVVAMIIALVGVSTGRAVAEENKTTENKTAEKAPTEETEQPKASSPASPSAAKPVSSTPAESSAPAAASSAPAPGTPSSSSTATASENGEVVTGQAKKAEVSATVPPAPSSLSPEHPADTSNNRAVTESKDANPPIDVAPAEIVPPVPLVAIRPAEATRSPEPAPSATKPSVLRGEWTKSILFSTDDGSFRFQPRGWVQPRFNISINPTDSVSDDERMDGTGFSLQRGRFGFQAWLFDWAHFYLDTGWKSGAPTLVDYFTDVGPKNGEGPIGVRVGFFRPYFVRQLLHATTKLAMIDYARAWTDSSLDLGLGPSGRQLGVAVQGFVLGGLEYAVGIWNGSDGYETDADFMYGGRLAVHPLGFGDVGRALRPGDESDAGHSDRPGLSIGAAVYAEHRDQVTADIWTSPPYEDLQLKTGVDVAFQYAGLSVEGEFFLVRRWADESVIENFLDRYHRTAPGIGTYVQIGYAAIKERLEVVGRFDMVDENVDFRGTRFYPTVGATYFIYGNNLKVQLQYRLNAGINYEKKDPDYIDTTHDILLMLQASI